jgi:hypothetical protein
MIILNYVLVFVFLVSHDSGSELLTFLEEMVVVLLLFVILRI